MSRYEMWTEEEVTEVLRLTGQGFSSAEVSKIVKKTRSAVLGKINRLTKEGVVVFRPEKEKSNSRHAIRHRKNTEERAAKRAKEKEEKQELIRKTLELSRAREEEKRRKEEIARTKFKPANIMELDKNQCRYIIDDSTEDFAIFCRAEKKEGSSYCANHHSLCYQKAPAKRVIYQRPKRSLYEIRGS